MLRRSWSMLLGLSIASAGVPACKKKAPPADAGDDAATSSPLRARVAEALAPSSFAVLGDVVRGQRRAVVVWPGLSEGEASAPMAFVFTQDGEQWNPVDDPIDLPKSGGAEILSEALGGADGQRIVRECGLPADALAEHLQQHGKRFEEALAQGDSNAASSAYEEMARAFAWQHVGTSALLLDLLLNPAPKSWFCGPKGCTVETSLEDRRRMQSFAHDDCGDGKVVGDALATQP
jgi:hypothetical protein